MRHGKKGLAWFALPGQRHKRISTPFVLPGQHNKNSARFGLPGRPKSFCSVCLTRRTKKIKKTFFPVCLTRPAHQKKFFCPVGLTRSAYQFIVHVREG